MLRDPVKRAVSNYLFSLANGLETLGIEEAFEQEAFRSASFRHSASLSTSPYAYIARGEYIRYLDFWSELITPENLILIVMESFIGTLDKIQSLYRTLGVNQAVIPSGYDQVFNVSDNRNQIELPAPWLKRLSRHYLDFNHSLAQKYSLDLSAWSA